MPPLQSLSITTTTVFVGQISYDCQKLMAQTQSRQCNAIKILENITVTASHAHSTELFTIILNLLLPSPSNSAMTKEIVSTLCKYIIYMCWCVSRSTILLSSTYSATTADWPWPALHKISVIAVAKALVRSLEVGCFGSDFLWSPNNRLFRTNDCTAARTPHGPPW